MEGYRTVAGVGSSRYEDRKSVFLGVASPVHSEAEATEFIAKIKAEYPDARHHVYAYRLRENAGGRFSDDREPQGSAGLPVLDILRHGDLVDVAVVVVRYFGGTLLGVGGLVHAYGTAASNAVADAGLIERRPCDLFAIQLNYTDYQKVLPLLALHGAVVENTDYAVDVTVYGNVPQIKTEALEVAIRNATADRAYFSRIGQGFFDAPVKKAEK